MPCWVSTLCFYFPLPQSTFPLSYLPLLFFLRPDPTECLQMVKQEEMGRKGREGRARHRARGSPSSAEGWPKSCSRQRGRDSCCGGRALQRERNGLETALFYTLISHRSCPWNLICGREKPKSAGPREKWLLKRGPSALWGCPALPLPSLLLQDRVEEQDSRVWLCKALPKGCNPFCWWICISHPLNWKWKQLLEGTPPIPSSGAADRSWQARQCPKSGCMGRACPIQRRVLH